MEVQACNPSTLRAEAGGSPEFLSSKPSSLQSQLQESQGGKRMGRGRGEECWDNGFWLQSKAECGNEVRTGL